jgi:hypothetical protein
MTTQTLKTEREVSSTFQVRWDCINEPRCYFSNWSGHLIRIPEFGLKPGFSPVIEIIGKEPMIVTRLSEDPYLQISKARMIAADLDLEVNF